MDFHYVFFGGYKSQKQATAKSYSIKTNANFIIPSQQWSI